MMYHLRIWFDSNPQTKDRPAVTNIKFRDFILISGSYLQHYHEKHTNHRIKQVTVLSTIPTSLFSLPYQAGGSTLHLFACTLGEEMKALAVFEPTFCLLIVCYWFVFGCTVRLAISVATFIYVYFTLYSFSAVGFRGESALLLGLGYSRED